MHIPQDQIIGLATFPQSRHTKEGPQRKVGKMISGDSVRTLHHDIIIGGRPLLLRSQADIVQGSEGGVCWLKPHVGGCFFVVCM